MVGITIVLSDGKVAKAGSKVIKNVAGYDLAKLFAGSFGTLGLIGSVSVRLHPLPAQTATVTVRARGPGRAPAPGARALPAAAGGGLLRRAWEGDQGWLSLRFGGSSAVEQARRVSELIEAGYVTVETMATTKAAGKPRAPASAAPTARS